MSIDAAALATASGIRADVAARLLPVVAATVERYAPSAPSGVQNEAAIRFAAYLAMSKVGLGTRKVGIGSLDVEPAASAPAFRQSGAAGLLSPWKVRRAGRVEAGS